MRKYGTATLQPDGKGIISSGYLHHYLNVHAKLLIYILAKKHSRLENKRQNDATVNTMYNRAEAPLPPSFPHPPKTSIHLGSICLAHWLASFEPVAALIKFIHPPPRGGYESPGRSKFW